MSYLNFLIFLEKREFHLLVLFSLMKLMQWQLKEDQIQRNYKIINISHLLFSYYQKLKFLDNSYFIIFKECLIKYYANC